MVITAYYPSPYGVYKNLRTREDTFLAVQGGSSKVVIGTAVPDPSLNPRLYVEGNLRINGDADEAFTNDAANGANIVISRKSSDLTSPRLTFVDTALGQVDKAPAWGIDNYVDRFRIFRVSKTIGLEHFTVTNAGNVGIGTGSPAKKLEVNGTLGFTGGTGPFCMFMNVCPNGWTNKGLGGYLYYNGQGATCPYENGGQVGPHWTWCHPRICCNE